MTFTKIIELYRALATPEDHVSSTEHQSVLITITILRTVGQARVYGSSRHADGEDLQCVLERAAYTYRQLAVSAEIERQRQAMPLVVQATR